MNVRHGEVKLAENTNNIDATLSHASLLAATIDGDKTMVMASYSPVSVEKWNYGQLHTDYSENVDLKEVKFWWWSSKAICNLGGMQPQSSMCKEKVQT